MYVESSGGALPWRQADRRLCQWSTAFNIVARKEARRADDAFNELMEEPHERPSPPSSPRTNPSTEPQVPVASDTSTTSAEISIFTGEFVSWASVYSGPLFNFVHCDFPYGIGLDKSDQGYSAQWGSYSDRVEIYWSLIEALISNIDRIMAPSSILCSGFLRLRRDSRHYHLSRSKNKPSLQPEATNLVQVRQSRHLARSKTRPSSCL